MKRRRPPRRSRRAGRSAGACESRARSTRVQYLFLRCDRELVAVAPLLPGPVVIPELVVAKEVEREEVDRCAHTDETVRDNLLRWQDASRLVDLLQLVRALERPLFGVEQIFPIHRNRRGDEAAATDVSRDRK